MTTKLQETINGMGGNIKPLLDELKKLANEVQELTEKRDEVNAAIAEKRARVKALGISKKAFDFGMKRKLMDEDQRDQLDENYNVVCSALGVPLKQGDLFTATPNEKEKGDANSKKQNSKSIGEQQAEHFAKAGNA